MLFPVFAGGLAGEAFKHARKVSLGRITQIGPNGGGAFIGIAEEAFGPMSLR